MLLSLILAATVPTATPTPAPAAAPAPTKLSGGFGKTAAPRPAGSRPVTIVGIREGRYEPPTSTPAPDPDATQAPAKAPPPPAAAEQQNEIAWRMRYRALRDDLTRAETEQRHAAESVVVQGHQPGSFVWEEAVRQAMAPYKGRVDAARAAIDNLRSECRRTDGCQPGWTRD